jgi:hypothetical protein
MQIFLNHRYNIYNNNINNNIIKNSIRFNLYVFKNVIDFNELYIYKKKLYKNFVNAFL